MRKNQKSRNLKIYAAICDGATQEEVGERFGLTQVRVSQIATEVSKYLEPQCEGQIDKIRHRHTVALWAVYEESMAAWERSQKNAEMERIESGGKDGGKTVLESRGQCGDPSYLAQAMGALDRIRKIWGANAPEKTAPTNANGDGPPVIEVVIKDRTELAGMKSLPDLQRFLSGSN